MENPERIGAQITGLLKHPYEFVSGIRNSLILQQHNRKLHAFCHCELVDGHFKYYFICIISEKSTVKVKKLQINFEKAVWPSFSQGSTNNIVIHLKQNSLSPEIFLLQIIQSKELKEIERHIYISEISIELVEESDRLQMMEIIIKDKEFVQIEWHPRSSSAIIILEKKCLCTYDITQSYNTETRIHYFSSAMFKDKIPTFVGFFFVQSARVAASVVSGQESQMQPNKLQDLLTIFLQTKEGVIYSLYPFMVEGMLLDEQNYRELFQQLPNYQYELNHIGDNRYKLTSPRSYELQESVRLHNKNDNAQHQYKKQYRGTWSLRIGESLLLMRSGTLHMGKQNSKISFMKMDISIQSGESGEIHTLYEYQEQVKGANRDEMWCLGELEQQVYFMMNGSLYKLNISKLHNTILSKEYDFHRLNCQVAKVFQIEIESIISLAWKGCFVSIFRLDGSTVYYDSIPLKTINFVDDIEKTINNFKKQFNLFRPTSQIACKQNSSAKKKTQMNIIQSSSNDPATILEATKKLGSQYIEKLIKSRSNMEKLYKRLRTYQQKLRLCEAKREILANLLVTAESNNQAIKAKLQKVNSPSSAQRQQQQKLNSLQLSIQDLLGKRVDMTGLQQKEKEKHMKEVIRLGQRAKNLRESYQEHLRKFRQ